MRSPAKLLPRQVHAAVAFEAGKPLEIADFDLEGLNHGDVRVVMEATGIFPTRSD